MTPPTGPPEERATLEVGGRSVQVTNLTKPLYPTGFTKAEVIAYYAAVAPVLLPHVQGRPMTLRRWPDGTDAQPFYAKNVPRGAPRWVRTVVLDSPGSTRSDERVEYVVVDDVATLVWVANLAGLELHVPQWQVDAAGEPLHPDRLVVDLDPGAPADLVTCCQVALAVRSRLAADGLDLLVKTSGAKGMQGYVALDGTADWEAVHAYARQVAEDVERELPRLVVSRMEKVVRRGRVLVDWSQNHRGKTTVAPYSLRGRRTPSVSTPVTWEEVVEVADSGDATSLVFEPADVVARIETHGDLLADLLVGGVALPDPA